MAAGLVLAALSTVAALSAGRLFEDTSGAYPAVVAALAVHGLLRYTAERRWNPLAAGLAVAAGAGLVALWTVVPHTTVYGVPTGSTLDELARRFQHGMVAFRTGQLPAAPGAGVELTVLVAATLVALGADRNAFAARRPLGALVPALALFALTSALGAEGPQALLVAAFVVTSCGFLLLSGPGALAVLRPRPGAPRVNRGAMALAAVPLVVVALVVGTLVTPRLPGARAEALVGIARTDPDAVGDRVTVSPLLDIRDRLAADPPVEVFTVSAAAPAYWRIAALDHFDGDSWSSGADYGSARGRFPSDAEGIPTESLTQTFSIGRLSQFWLPAAYRPTSVDLPGARVDPESLTLITDRPTADGLVYTVESEVPRYDYGLLSQARPTPRAMTSEVVLPNGVPADVARLTESVAAGAETPVDALLRLQNFFRNEFTYRTDVPAGHSEARLRHFLLDSREGYCEQFAASFALMARWLGLPSRVAVGFTPGAYDPAIRGYRVTTADAHAWPEVYLHPFGWVTFEPTPGRHEPSPANHTNTYDRRLYAIHVEPGVTTRADPGTVEDEQLVIEDLPPSEPDGDTADGADAAAPRSAGETEAFNTWRVLAGIGFLLLAAFGVWWMARRRLRRVRRTRRGARESIVGAWEDVYAAAARRLPLTTALTPREVGEHLVLVSPDPLEERVTALRELAERAAYRGGDFDERVVIEAWRLRDEVVADLRRAKFVEVSHAGS